MSSASHLVPVQAAACSFPLISSTLKAGLSISYATFAVRASMASGLPPRVYAAVVSLRMKF